ncbi:mercuric transporter MerT family protein [Mesorhizobium sp. VK23B]|uniref:Mercuric transport protein MerT n=1 Tax=Mesorhizobium dulcispinae TaxID=3072316 RepID=A0ABU4XAY8_9HYPH|nr:MULTISPECIES: mercuric transporter MerT family protein [unclassified Mesorhizobium]MDX8466148.1 mercuric transporter MerT family protein [Mesorhizobium sp. VK23B]MDX8471959.1 mercuric transporter MerT family protein [Mesorhizobium sp. VK23A]MDX8517448.1 mercuric transporter MerT family protein [Mesorhizobium sp. VK23D]
MIGPSPIGSNSTTSRAALPLALGGLSAGLLASACCILPLALALAGISGAWIARLTALAPYQPYFLTVAVVSIGLGLWRHRGSEAACLPGSLCASPVYRRSIRWILLAASLLAASAAAVDVYGQLNL